MIAEKVKLVVLLGSLVVCLLSLVTSQKSFQLGPRDLPLLTPQVNKFCGAIYKARNKCIHTEENQNCQGILKEASQCEIAVQQAYRYINTAGCPYPLRDVTLCELERCGGYHGAAVMNNHIPSHSYNNNDINDQTNHVQDIDAIDGCVHHCDQSRKTLEICVKDNVQKYLKQYGVRQDQ